ncbi:uncharacterized protein [Macrobrachium rosenbergii]
MNFLAFWITAMFIIGSASTEGETLSDNEIVTVEDEVEGRSCYDCHGGQGGHGHGGGGSHEIIDQGHTSIQYGSGGYENGQVGGWGFGFGGIGIVVIPIIGLNIAIVILLAIILKHLVKITEHLGYVEEEPIFQPIYTGVSTYQTYDHGGAYGGGAGYGGAVNSYGGSHVGGYKKRASTAEGRNMADASTVNFLSSIVGGALDKYSKVDVEE